MKYRDHADQYRRQRRGERKAKRKAGFMFPALAVLLLAVLVVFIKSIYIRVETESFPFTESARNLNNPDRGFYHLYTFLISEEPTDYDQMIKTLYQNDTDTELTLVKICLQNYRGGRISETGIENIEKLFDALESLDKRMILRFVYDDEGKGEEHEPESLDVILWHMQQLKPVLNAHSGQIFIQQGLFTGAWGEMNGTRYGGAKDMKRLAEQLAAVTDTAVYMAVRTPAQWRGITGSGSPAEAILSGSQTAARLSLFNDGLLGNSSDYGTYKTDDSSASDPLGRWGREEELEFQRELCSYVPNGGEVINDNPYNDFENAVKGLAERHITYLNRDYDQAVLNKWEKAAVSEAGCFYGMDGYTYIDRHLGYRLLIADVCLEYRQKQRCVSAEVSLKNAGFAPLYKTPKVILALYNEDGEEVLSKEMSCDVKSLVGGTKTDQCRSAYTEIPVGELSRSDYMAFFSIEDSDTGRHILLANEQDAEEYGYRIGTVKVRW